MCGRRKKFMNSRWNKLSEMFPCEIPPRDSYVPPPPPTSLAALRRLGKDLGKLLPLAHMMLLGDRTTPILAREPVWESREMRWLVKLVEKRLFPQAAMMKCDLCGQHKESVRQRKVITVGMKSGSVRTKFCDECAATVTSWLQPEDREHQ
jgi:uncharacterized protein YlaI